MIRRGGAYTVRATARRASPLRDGAYVDMFKDRVGRGNYLLVEALEDFKSGRVQASCARGCSYFRCHRGVLAIAITGERSRAVL